LRVAVDFKSLEVLLNHINLGRIKNMLMSAYHNSGAGRPPIDPLGLFRFKIVLFLKGYRSQRALEREVRVDGRVKRLCGFKDVPSHSTIARFERRIGFERLSSLVRRVVEELVSCGFIKGLNVVLERALVDGRHFSMVHALIKPRFYNARTFQSIELRI